MNSEKRLVLAITGATGMVYVTEFLKLLATASVEVHGVISFSGRQVLDLELGITVEELPGVARWFAIDDFAAPMSSGSAQYDGMVILPCTVGTLGGIAGGYSANLIHRAADVSLKERRPLVMAVRETPLNGIHLKNMLSLHEAGAIICPPMPSFYQHPETINDLAKNFAVRICDQLKIEVAGAKRWQGIQDVK